MHCNTNTKKNTETKNEILYETIFEEIVFYHCNWKPESKDELKSYAKNKKFEIKDYFYDRLKIVYRKAPFIDLNNENLYKLTQLYVQQFGKNPRIIIESPEFKDVILPVLIDKEQKYKSKQACNQSYPNSERSSIVTNHTYYSNVTKQ